MSVLSAWIGMNSVDRRLAKAQLLRGGTGRRINVGIASAVPGEERPANAQERRSVFRGDRKRSHRPGGNDVEATPQGDQRLGAPMNDLSVVERTYLDRALHEATLAGGAFEQHELSSRKRNRQRQTGKPGSGAEI
jgi:hypothetical protein